MMLKAFCDWCDDQIIDELPQGFNSNPPLTVGQAGVELGASLYAMRDGGDPLPHLHISCAIETLDALRILYEAQELLESH